MIIYQNTQNYDQISILKSELKKKDNSARKLKSLSMNAIWDSHKIK